MEALVGWRVLGTGVDVVDLERFRMVITRRPRLVERVFTEAEQAYARRFKDPTARLAARFAAREAVMKTMGVGIGACALREIEVVRGERGAPGVSVHGRAAELATERGVEGWHLSLTHSDIVAVAFAVAVG